MAKEKEEAEKQTCFMIMPFGGWFDKYYEDIYKPAIEEAGFIAKRADDLYRPGNIVNDIWTYTKEASVILADLTNKNPNVFYELGLAHAITKPAVLITASMDDVPFDLRSLRVIEFDKNAHNWGDILKQKIVKSLEETLKSPEDAIPPTFLDTSKTKRLKVSEEEKDILDLRKELNSLKREVRSSTEIRREIRKEDEISPDEAEQLIKHKLEQGLHPMEIAEQLRPLGPPIDWTMKKVDELKN